MKRKSRSLIWLVLCWLILCGCTNNQGNILSSSPTQTYTFSDEKVILEILMDRLVYQQGESIQVTVSLKNTNSEIYFYLFNTQFASTVSLTILDENGNQIRSTSGYIEPRLPNNHNFVWLYPLSGYNGVFNLEFYYGTFPVGKYRIQAIYTNEIDPPDGSIAWKGTLLSNVLEFTVLP